ncbi:MAG: nucleoside recognition domain-containing protein [Lentilitoribacter sp.]
MNYLRSLLTRSLRTAATLFKIMLPAMILVRILDQFGFSQSIGEFIGPVMALVGLPAEAGIVWAVAMFSSLFGGIGALITLAPQMDLNVGQVSILAAMMLFAHALVIEQAVVHKAGANFFTTSIIRIVAGFLYALIAYQVIDYLDVLQEPAKFTWAPEGLESDDWLKWSIATAQSMAIMFIIIVALLVLLDVIDRLGINRLLSRLLAPVHDLIGIRRELAPITTVGLLMGIAYGGGLIIEQLREKAISKRELFLTLSFLSIFHAVIEDTLLMMAFGADIWVILVFRGIFSVIFMAILARMIFFKREPAINPAQ